MISLELKVLRYLVSDEDIAKLGVPIGVGLVS